MRLYIVLIIITLAMLSLGVYTMESMAKTTDEVISNFPAIAEKIHSENWEEAQEELRNAERVWDKHKTHWTLIINHREIDDIDQSFTRLKEYIREHNRPLARAEIAVLELSLQNIPEKQEVNLENIL